MLKWSHGLLLKTTPLPHPPKSAHRSSGAVASLMRKEKQSMMLQDLVCSSDPTLPPTCSYWPRCSHRTNKVLLACSCPLNGLPAATPQHTCISFSPFFPCLECGLHPYRMSPLKAEHSAAPKIWALPSGWKAHHVDSPSEITPAFLFLRKFL